VAESLPVWIVLIIKFCSGDIFKEISIIIRLDISSESSEYLAQTCCRTDIPHNYFKSPFSKSLVNILCVCCVRICEVLFFVLIEYHWRIWILFAYEILQNFDCASWTSSCINSLFIHWTLMSCTTLVIFLCHFLVQDLLLLTTGVCLEIKAVVSESVVTIHTSGDTINSDYVPCCLS